MTFTLFIVNDAPYGNERAYNALRLASALGSRDGQTVRLFLTHAIWNDAARLALSGRTQEVFGDKKTGTSLGIQAETWW